MVWGASGPALTTTIQLKDLGGGVFGSSLKLASRSSAVAGFGIQFDAGEDDVDLFRERLYIWDYGDPSSGTWQDGKSKNADYGPIGGHAYETAGTYHITCEVRDATGLLHTLTDSITITDPDIVYAGSLTTCISTGVDFTGAPVGATLITLTDLTQIPTYLVSNQRVLLKRGDVWNVDAAVAGNTYTGVSDVFFGAFGVGTSPDVLGIFTNEPEINMTGIVSEQMFALNSCSRWVFSHLSFVGAQNTHSWTGGQADWLDITYTKIKSEGFHVPIGNGNFGTQGHIGTSYIENRINGAEGNCMFTGAEKLLILGGIYSNAQTSHVIRVWHGYHWCCRHNDISGSSVANTNGRQLIKYHGPKEGDISPDGPWTGIAIRTRSEFAVLSDNILGAGGPWPLSIAPQDTASDERIRAVIVESNRSIADYGQNSSVLVSIAIRVEVSNSVVRNNVVDSTGAGTTGMVAVAILSGGVVAEREDTHAYNNTVYLLEGNTYSNQAQLFQIGVGALNSVVKNNLCNLPASATTPPLMVVDLGTGTVASSNLLTADPKYTDVSNVDPLLRDFSVLAGSPAIGAGEDVPVFIDIDGVSRTSGAYDLGAYQE